MKKVLTLILALAAIPAFAQTINVPGNQRAQIAFPDQPNQAYELTNMSGRALEISVVNKVSGEQISGFGLGPVGKATINVPELALLEITNPGNKQAKIGYKLIDRKPEVREKKDVYIDFTLRNETMKSIPLIIPGVMNPNLSPMSNSGVSLKIGQEVKFKKKGRVRVLFVVDESIKNGDVLKVGKLIQDYE